MSNLGTKYPERFALKNAHPALYGRWQRMKTRCYNANYHNWSRYGGRGIAVCDEWRNDFNAFATWALAAGFRPDLELDRIDNDGDYSPHNCRWTDKKRQARNRSTAHLITLDGKTQCLTDWLEQYGIPTSNRLLVQQRLRHGMDARVALTAPIQGNMGRPRPLTQGGES